MSGEEQEVIVRGSDQHQNYLQYEYGKIKDAVNGFETRLAIASRPLLFFYVAYITVRASISGALPKVPAITYGLLALDGIMLLLQVMGLEGSMPGLLHLADEMEAKGKHKEAKSMLRSSKAVQWLLGATAIDIVLQATPTIGTYNIQFVTDIYSKALLITRVVFVGMYLVNMARLSHKGPKIISEAEAKQKAEAEEQKQIRIDNANIMAAVEKGIEAWAKPMVATLKGALEVQIQQLSQQAAEDRAAMKTQIEALQMASGSALTVAEIGRQVDASMAHVIRQIDAKIDASLPNIDALTQRILTHVRASLPASEIDVDKLTQGIMTQVDAKIDARRPASTPPRQPAQPKVSPTPSIRPASPPSGIPEIGSMGKKEYFAEFDKDRGLLALNSYALAEKFTGNRNMEPTARRAKAAYLDLHPELKEMAV